MLQFPFLKECNIFVAFHDMSQAASQARAEMANQAMISLITLRPSMTNRSPTFVLSAREPHPV